MDKPAAVSGGTLGPTDRIFGSPGSCGLFRSRNATARAKRIGTADLDQRGRRLRFVAADSASGDDRWAIYDACKTATLRG